MAENEKTIIMDTGEPYVHIPTLYAHIVEATKNCDPALVPGMDSVLDLLRITHDTAVLADRKD